VNLREKLRWLPLRLGYRWGPLLMSRIRRRWVVLRHPYATIDIHPTAYLGPGFSLHITGPGTFVAGPGCEFRLGFRAEIAGEGRIEFGEGCICTYYTLMHCTTAITCGDQVMIGQSALVVDGQHRYRDPTQPILAQGYDYTPLTLGDGVAIAAKVSIMASVGERTFVGANAVVTRDLPAFCLALGAPAKPVEYYGPPGQEPAELAAS